MNCSRPSTTGGDSKRDHITPEFAYGWNGGFSESAGVGRVLRYLKALPPAERPTTITIDTVFAAAAAAAANATRHLSNPRKLRYSKGVAASFLREFERDVRDRAATPAVA